MIYIKIMTIVIKSGAQQGLLLGGGALTYFSFFLHTSKQFLYIRIYVCPHNVLVELFMYRSNVYYIFDNMLYNIQFNVKNIFFF